MTALRLWTCTDHATHYPVGGASVVVAETEEAARELLRAALSADGLDPDDEPFTLREVSLERPAAVVLCNGK